MIVGKSGVSPADSSLAAVVGFIRPDYFSMKVINKDSSDVVAVFEVRRVHPMTVKDFEHRIECVRGHAFAFSMLPLLVGNAFSLMHSLIDSPSDPRDLPEWFTFLTVLAGVEVGLTEGFSSSELFDSV